MGCDSALSGIVLLKAPRQKTAQPQETRIPAFASSRPICIDLKQPQPNFFRQHWTKECRLPLCKNHMWEEMA
ncbi:unnamed protein product, partial [Iphiclides podalirius]